jgi:ABC-type oligopeptide transport system ATPase subunit
MSAILEIDHVSKRFAMGGVFSRSYVEAVVDASFTIEEGQPEVFTIVGESGSGKTTLARMILGLEEPSEGDLRLAGQTINVRRNRANHLEFMRHVQPVFQNPFEAFNPLKHVHRYLEASARVLLGVQDDDDVDTAMDDALQKVGLSLAEIKGRYGHELSGGQLQRVAIARALIPNPEVLIADEPVSMVDASLRMSIVNLLRDLRDNFNVTVIYITHDLATAYYISDRLAIMQKGYIVEMGPAQTILESPEHPYAQLLKDSVLSVTDAGKGKVEAPDRSLAQEAAEQSGTGMLVAGLGGRLVRRAS